MIVYNFFDFCLGNFRPNNDFIRLRALDDQSVRLIKVACPFPFSIANQFVEIPCKIS